MGRAIDAVVIFEGAGAKYHPRLPATLKHDRTQAGGAIDMNKKTPEETPGREPCPDSDWARDDGRTVDSDRATSTCHGGTAPVTEAAAPWMTGNMPHCN